MTTGHEGDLCQTNINECDVSAPCQNSAVCMDTPGSYKCQCRTGFAGKNCEDVRTKFVKFPYRNFHNCKIMYVHISNLLKKSTAWRMKEKNVTVKSIENKLLKFIKIFKFLCTEQGVDECASNPCQSGGTCTGDVGFYTCACIVVS